MRSDDKPAPRGEHYAASVTNLPPTEVVCKCGARFSSADPLAEQKAHMLAEQKAPG